MITLRKAAERGRTNIDWLDSWHSFSFGDYYNPQWMGFGPLRVINDDIVHSGGGFGTHPHHDMEIITYVVSGALEHKDSLGTGSVIRRGEVQRMTAGTGIRHSEFNPSANEAVRLLQIWITPDKKGLEPSYEQRTIGDDQKQGRLRLIASKNSRDGAVTINQDADVYAALLKPNEKLSHPLRPGRTAWVQVITGNVAVNGTSLQAGDGAAIENESSLELAATQPAELLLFDMAA